MTPSIDNYSIDDHTTFATRPSPTNKASGGAEVPAVAHAPSVEPLVEAAIARLRRDLETHDAGRPALTYALAGETHGITLKQWRYYPPEFQSALLTAFLTEVSELVREFEARIDQMVATQGHMFGIQDEVIKLEKLVDVARDEALRIQCDLSARAALSAPQP